MVDSNNVEVPGLGGTFTLELAANTGVFIASAGTKAEKSAGWYTYLATALESVRGIISVRVNGAGCVQQNLVYVCGSSNPLGQERTYIVTDSVSFLPVAGAVVWITTDVAGTQTRWFGHSDMLGVARYDNGYKPWLDPGTYYYWSLHPLYTTDAWPDTEIY